MTKIEVSFHSKQENKLIEIDSYDEDETIAELSNNETQHIKLGRNIYSKIDVKNIEIIE